MSRVVRRDPSSTDGGAQNARDDAMFDSSKAAQALAVARRAEVQARAVASMVARAQSAADKRVAGGWGAACSCRVINDVIPPQLLRRQLAACGLM